MRSLFFFLFAVFINLGCEKTVNLSLPPIQERLVIQGHIEPNEFAYVSIARNMPFFGRLDSNALAQLLVLDAQVVVSDGIIFDTLVLDFKFQHYTVFNYRGTKLKGKENTTYWLYIQTPQHTLKAVTQIPIAYPIDSFFARIKEPTITQRDSQLFRTYYQYTDPDTPGNFVRAFTKRNSETQWSSDFQSVYEDGLINGQSLEFVIRRGKEPYIFNDSTSFQEFGFFEKGDTVYLKWCTIDRAHYTFWRTLEISASTVGNPFAQPLQVQSNIQAIKGGAIGVWGGYGTTLYSLIIK